MPDCELATSCIFFNNHMKNMPDRAGLFKKRYCHGDNSFCARYLVCQSLGPQRIPDDLFPGDILKAKTIISSQ